jgi:hypothetical protein
LWAATVFLPASSIIVNSNVAEKVPVILMPGNMTPAMKWHLALHSIS